MRRFSLTPPTERGAGRDRRRLHDRPAARRSSWRQDVKLTARVQLLSPTCSPAGASTRDASSQRLGPRFLRNKNGGRPRALARVRVAPFRSRDGARRLPTDRKAAPSDRPVDGGRCRGAPATGSDASRTTRTLIAVVASAVPPLLILRLTLLRPLRHDQHFGLLPHRRGVEPGLNIRRSARIFGTLFTSLMALALRAGGVSRSP